MYQFVESFVFYYRFFGAGGKAYGGSLDYQVLFCGELLPAVQIHGSYAVSFRFLVYLPGYCFCLFQAAVEKVYLAGSAQGAEESRGTRCAACSQQDYFFSGQLDPFR